MYGEDRAGARSREVMLVGFGERCSDFIYNGVSTVSCEAVDNARTTPKDGIHIVDRMRPVRRGDGTPARELAIQRGPNRTA